MNFPTITMLQRENVSVDRWIRRDNCTFLYALPQLDVDATMPRPVLHRQRENRPSSSNCTHLYKMKMS